MGGLKGWDGADRHRCQEGAPQGMFSVASLCLPAHLGQPPCQAPQALSGPVSSTLGLEGEQR